MPWIWKKTGACLGAGWETDTKAINLLSESPFVTTPSSTGICLIFSLLLRSFPFYPPVLQGLCWAWFWSSNWLLPSNPFWFPQNANWPVPCLCYSKFLHSVPSLCLFFIFQGDLTSPFPNISLERFVKPLKSWLPLPSLMKHSPGVIYLSDPQLPQSLVWTFPITHSVRIHIYELFIDEDMPEDQCSHSIQHSTEHWAESSCLENMLGQMDALS